MQFIKMHGAGNDYVFVDCFRQHAPVSPAEVAFAVSDRHTGIGGDGLILIESSDVADAKMRMWNADGSAGEMCGNGLRCVAKFLYDSGLVSRNEMRIETGRGVLTAEIVESAQRESRVRIDMGRPIFRAAEIPTTLPGNPPLNVPLSAERTFSVSAISMGNPHCVIFVEEPTDELVLRFGPIIERHAAFPQRTNVEFVVVTSREELRIRVWERGSGETQACGTGACAAVVAGILTDRLSRTVRCQLPGGRLDVSWEEDGPVFLTGPATEVFRGEYRDVLQ